MSRDVCFFILLLMILMMTSTEPISATSITLPNISLPEQCLFGSRFSCSIVSDNITEYSSRSAIIERSQSFLRRPLLEIGLAGLVDKNSSMDSRSDINRIRIMSLLRRLRSLYSDTVSNFTFVVFGSSMTTGVGVGGRNNAWPHLLQLRMNNYLAENGITSSNVTVINKAEGGSTSIWALASLDALLSDVLNTTIDLVIIDYDITDCSHLKDSLSERLHVMASTELLIRRLLQHNKKPAIMFTNVAVSHEGSQLQQDCKIHNTCYSMGEIRLPVLQAYGCPIVSQKMAIWEHFSCPLANHWPCSRYCSHPLQAAQNLMTDLVYTFLTNCSEQSLSNWYANRTKSDASAFKNSLNDNDLSVSDFLIKETATLEQQICDLPMVAIDAHGSDIIGDHDLDRTADLLNHRSFNLIRFNRLYANNQSKHYGHLSVVNAYLGLNFSYNTCWIYEEDVKGKAGLIANDCWNATSMTLTNDSVNPNRLMDSIIVPVTYGPFPRLTLTFLSTYSQNTGCIRIFTVRITNNTIVERLLYPLTLPSNWTNVLLKEDIMARLPWEDINWLDPKRPSEEKLSLTSVHSFIPEPTHYTERDFQYGELTDPNFLLPYHSYLVKISQINANEQSISSTNEKQGRGGFRSSPQKFKLYSISAC